MDAEILSRLDGQVLDRSGEVYARLLKERIVFLGTQVDDNVANLICAQLLLLESEDPDRDVFLYINSPGGSVTAGMAVYHTKQDGPPGGGTTFLGPRAAVGQVLPVPGDPGQGPSPPPPPPPLAHPAAPK